MMNSIFGAFFLGETELALNVSSIQEVVNFPEKMTPMPLAPDFLVGVFNLRGLIIPVINLKKLLKFESHTIAGSEKVAIVEHDGIRVGLIFDRTSEILRLKEEMQSRFTYSEGSGPNVIYGAIKLEDGNRILQLLNPFSLVSIENIPQIAEYQQKTIKASFRSGYHHENRKKCISFLLGNMKMAFDISAIHEIVRVTEIQESTFKTEISLGIINLRGQVVPIINFARLVGVVQGNMTDVSEKRIIILKLDQEFFGLLVDSVESISTYLTTEIVPVPLFQKNRSSMFTGCISIEDEEIMLLDAGSVLSNNELVEITRGHSNIYKINDQNKEERLKKSSLRESYISFKLGHLFGVSINDIREIINYPEKLLNAPGLPSYVLGMLNLRGEMITIIETRALYKFKEEKGKILEPKILIFIMNGEKFGLLVDSVESIVTVSSDQKMKVPELMVQQIRSQLENDIKEIISVPVSENKEGALIILNIGPVTERIRRAISA